MFRFIKKVFVLAMTFFSFNPLNENSMQCFSMNNQEFKRRKITKIINNNEPVFYLFSIKSNKFG